MSRRNRKKEDWGGEASDDDVGSSSSPRVEGMDSVLARSRSKRALEFAGTKGEGEGEGGSSGDENDYESDGENGRDDVARTAETNEITANKREKSRASDGHKRRDHEMIHTHRLQQQGIELKEEEDDGDDEVAYGSSKDFRGHSQTQSVEEIARRKAKAQAKAAAEANKDGDVEMDVNASATANNMDDLDDPRVRHARMKALFDKNKDDKYMTFDAEDPLRPNPNKKRAAAREDEELEDDNKDPWLLQAAEDRARAIAEGRIDEHDSSSQKPLRSSTAIFDRDDQAPVFDQAAAREILLKHMKPGESVVKAVKRLGSSTTSNSSTGAATAPKSMNRMKNVRTKNLPPATAAASSTSAATTEDLAAAKERKRAFDELTEAAQGFIASGQPEIYQDTYEKIESLVLAHRARLAAAEAHRLARSSQAASSASASVPSASQDARARAAARLQRKRDARAAGLPEPESSDDDEEEDIYATKASAAATQPSMVAAATPASSSSSSSSLQWFYRWSADDATIQGPYPSSKMSELKRAGFLGSDVVVQRASGATPPSTTDGWRKLNEIDFETGQTPTQTTTHTMTHQEPPKKKFKF